MRENNLNSIREVLRVRMMRATLKGISHREVLNTASRGANGIKTLQRTRARLAGKSGFTATKPTLLTSIESSRPDTLLLGPLDQLHRGLA
jgi:hypothetical protein